VIAVLEEDDPRQRGSGRLQEEAVRSVPWALVTYASNRGVALLAQLALARLLVPEDFGVIALANTTTLLLDYLRGLGLASTLILRHDLSRRAQGTALTLMIAVSVVMALVGTALAPAIADLFDEETLTGVLRILAISVALGGLIAFGEAQLQKHLKFKERFIAMSTQALVYAAVSVGLAAAGLGVWSLAIGQVAMAITATLVTTYLSWQYWVAPRWNTTDAGDLLATSGGFLAQVLVSFVHRNTDYVVVGKILNANELGFYYNAYRLAEIPYAAISDPVSRVTFAAFAGMQARGEDIREAYLSVLRLIAVISCPLGVVLSGAAGPFTVVVLGDKWRPMIPVLTVLGLWALVRPLHNTAAWLLNSSGAPGVLARINAIFYVPLAGGVVAAAAGPGIVGVAWVVVGVTAAEMLAIVFACRRYVGVPPHRQLLSAGPALAASVPTWGATYLIAQLLESSPLAALPAAVLMGLAAYLATLSAIDFELVKRSADQIRRILSRR
jgi:lipopolysaccharide exporter